MKRIIFVTILMLLQEYTAFAAGPAPTLSLEQCVQVALTKSPDVAAAQALVQAARANVKVSHAGYLPQLNAGQSYTRETYNYAGTASASGAGTPPRLWNQFYTGQSNASANYYFGGLNFSQEIEDFGRTKGAVRTSLAQLQATQHNLTYVRDQIYYNVRAAYYTVIAARQTVDVETAAVHDAQRRLEQAQAFHHYGTAPEIDVTQEQVTLANAQLALTQAESNLKVERAQLATTMGLPVDQAPEPAETAIQFPPPGNFNQLLAEAERNRADLLAQLDQVNAALGNVLSAKGNMRPNISLSGLLSWQNLKWPLVYNWGLTQLLGQSIFSGGANRARLHAAEAQATATQYDVSSFKLQVQQQVFAASSAVQVAQEQIANATVADRYAHENLALADQSFRVGVGDIIQLDDAEYQATGAALQLVAARYNYQVASADLDFVLGRGPK
jgi:outer membrane protein